ncbi:MAG: hypothetical protein M1818_003640 [Claussenomyces sp. TS43310]|nr:MAG: hypothetical protein M1818_003640 [Claussenomyces sp. TS43310]
MAGKGIADARDMGDLALAGSDKDGDVHFTSAGPPAGWRSVTMTLTLEQESWTWYGVVVSIVLFRLTSRFLLLRSFKRLEVDDWIMMFILVRGISLPEFEARNSNAETNKWDPTGYVYAAGIFFASTNLMLPDEIPDLTPESIKERIYGSKLVIVVEEFMIFTIWGCKICLLILYNRLTFGLKQQLLVKIAAAYAMLGFVVMQILFLGVWCRPFHNYWAVPSYNRQCSVDTHHLITNLCVNVSSDLLMLSIPLPLLARSAMPLKKKIVLCGLFGMGIFVILCATLSKYYSFSRPFGSQWTFWYVREASVAILITNLPHCWPLFRRIFKLGALSANSGREEAADSNSGSSRSNPLNRWRTRPKGCDRPHHDRHVGSDTGATTPEQDPYAHLGRKSRTCNGSEERIWRNEVDVDEDAHGDGDGDEDEDTKSVNVVPLEIWRDIEIEIERELQPPRHRERDEEDKAVITSTTTVVGDAR